VAHNCHLHISKLSQIKSASERRRFRTATVELSFPNMGGTTVSSDTLSASALG